MKTYTQAKKFINLSLADKSTIQAALESLAHAYSIALDIGDPDTTPVWSDDDLLDMILRAEDAEAEENEHITFADSGLDNDEVDPRLPFKDLAPFAQARAIADYAQGWATTHPDEPLSEEEVRAILTDEEVGDYYEDGSGFSPYEDPFSYEQEATRL